MHLRPGKLQAGDGPRSPCRCPGGHRDMLMIIIILILIRIVIVVIIRSRSCVRMFCLLFQNLILQKTLENHIRVLCVKGCQWCSGDYGSRR